MKKKKCFWKSFRFLFCIYGHTDERIHAILCAPVCVCMNFVYQSEEKCNKIMRILWRWKAMFKMILATPLKQFSFFSFIWLSTLVVANVITLTAISVYLLLLLALFAKWKLWNHLKFVVKRIFSCNSCLKVNIFCLNNQSARDLTQLLAKALTFSLLLANLLGMLKWTVANIIKE